MHENMFAQTDMVKLPLSISTHTVWEYRIIKGLSSEPHEKPEGDALSLGIDNNPGDL